MLPELHSHSFACFARKSREGRGEEEKEKKDDGSSGVVSRACPKDHGELRDANTDKVNVKVPCDRKLSRRRAVHTYGRRIRLIDTGFLPVMRVYDRRMLNTYFLRVRV
uniref:Uncharacterized protein n=1 Tax=Vespula pensylvanica TaxID=30213 RepID=A0A834NXA2_VESPE|nr:hypothetical protein H0235_010595 [Vespula pensylvanica]